MNTRRPILAIEVHYLEVGLSTFKSMECIAAAVVQRMRQVQPVGPYTILGYSFGGNLAVEVARQLMRDHQVLESLVLLDAYAPGSLRSFKGLRKLATHLRIIKRLKFQDAWSYIFSRVRRRLHPQSQMDEAKTLPLPGDATERRISEISKAGLDALRVHRPEVFSGRMILLRATDLEDWMELTDSSGTCGWSSLCKGGVEVIAMDCRHSDVLKEPNVTFLAAHINDLLNAIDQADRNANAIELMGGRPYRGAEETVQ